MLTKFLLTNKFPANCFFTPYGPIQWYRFSNTKLTICNYDGKTFNYQNNNIPLEVIDIPPVLFYKYIDVYKLIIKQLNETGSLEATQKLYEGKTDWYDKLVHQTLNSLSLNLLHPLAIQGTITYRNAQSTYGFPNGEGVYIKSSTSTQYKVTTVDGQNFPIKKEHLTLSSSTSISEYTKTWAKTLKLLELEYAKFKSTIE